MESMYWKEYLAHTASDLRYNAKPKPLTQRRYEITERNIVVSFFILRRLIEWHKVSGDLRDCCIKIFCWPTTGKLPTLLNNHKIFKLYDSSNEKAHSKKLIYVCNQIIHSYTAGLLVDNARNWDSFLTVSDFDRKNCIWRIPIKTIIDILKRASKDCPSRARYTLNKVTGDYEVEV
jgi:hypothetical protein